MDDSNKFNHIEDVLVRLHTGQWFGWTDLKNRIYANLILTEKMGVGGELVDNPHTLPTEKSLTDALAKQQSEFNAQEYARNRAEAYDSIGNQLDMIYKDMKDGTTTHKASVEAVKAKFPKPE
tara:strand:- start:87 stop:452 length:366 start_codon:yes stop_codon:yes gene_type:complete